MQQFSHLWLLFYFHDIQQTTWKATVRPPRLGGNTRIGVFATRSMFRPNPIGLSLVELHGVTFKNNHPILKLGNVDLVDRTPILDIKPYLPFSDCQTHATAGYAQEMPQTLLNVIFTPNAQRVLQEEDTHDPHLQILIEQILKQDPRPAYHKYKNEHKIYASFLYDLNIKWQVDKDCVIVLDIAKAGDKRKP